MWFTGLEVAADVSMQMNGARTGCPHGFEAAHDWSYPGGFARGSSGAGVETRAVAAGAGVVAGRGEAVRSRHVPKATSTPVSNSVPTTNHATRTTRSLMPVRLTAGRAAVCSRGGAVAASARACEASRRSPPHNMGLRPKAARRRVPRCSSAS